MGYVFTDHEDEGLDQFAVVVFGIQFQMLLRILVDTDGILQLHDIHLLVCEITFSVVPSLGNRRNLHVLAIVKGLREVVLIDDVLEGFPFLVGRRSRHLQAKDGMQLIDGFLGGIGVVAVRLVHQDNQIREAGQIIEIRLAQIFGQPAHTGCAPLALLAVGVKLGDVEDVDFHRVKQVAAVQLEIVVVVAVDDDGRLADKLGDSLEDVFLIGRVAKVPLQFLV